MNAPNGWVRVTKERFYDVMNPTNVHPCPERHYSEWKLNGGSGLMIGWVDQGYIPIHGVAKNYYLPPHLAA